MSDAEERLRAVLQEAGYADAALEKAIQGIKDICDERDLPFEEAAFSLEVETVVQERVYPFRVEKLDTSKVFSSIDKPRRGKGRRGEDRLDGMGSFKR